MKVVRGDPISRFRLLVLLAGVLAPKYRFKELAMAWWDDPAFNAYLAEFDELGLLNTDRRWNLWQLLRLIGGVDGDTAECGVYRGSSSYLICDVTRRSAGRDRSHFVFDSFEGLSTPENIDGAYWERGDLSVPQEIAQTNLARFKNVHFLKGWIPDRFGEVEDRRFAFVHIDVDLAQPTLDSVAFFYERLNPGGVILCDDYGYTTCPGATRVIDDFLMDRPEKMLALSCGGGFMIKGVTTSHAITVGRNAGAAASNRTATSERASERRAA